MALTVVYKSPDEFMANSVKDLLEQHGIPAMVHSFQIPAYDGIAKMMRPEWGQVLVEEKDRDRAEEMIREFLSSGGRGAGDE